MFLVDNETGVKSLVAAMVASPGAVVRQGLRLRLVNVAESAAA
jgi:hypothetical protein